ncbi:MAG: efflux RND transporter periplasmic adaptor subunit [Bacteroides sp.]|nr:efflux RND transporter periplasmic adaptor subunit [Bacteroides sp.]
MKKHYCLLLFLCAALAGCKGEKENQKSDAVLAVKTLRVVSHAVGKTQGYSATIEETAASTLSFNVNGTLRSFPVFVGQKVSKGQLIAVIDDANIRNAYQIAKTTLEQAEDAYRRMKRLHDNNSLPEMQWIEVQSKLKQAQATEEISRKNLEDCKLYAPFSGVIAEKKVENGQNVMPGMPIVKLVTTDQVKVKIAVPENEIAKMETGQTARITVPAIGNKEYQGKIVERGVVANPMSRSYEVKALVENTTGELMPGMIGEMHLAGEEASAIQIPASVIQLDASNRKFVWLNQNGKAKKRFVETGAFTTQGVVVTQGLENGDELIVEGQQKVSENMNISTEKTSR